MSSCKLKFSWSKLSFSFVRCALQSSKIWELTLSTFNCSWSWVYVGLWIDIICVLWCGLCVPGCNLIFCFVGAGCSGLCLPIIIYYGCEWMLRVKFGCWWRWLVWAPVSNDLDKSVCGCGVVAERMFGIVGISLLCLLVQDVAVWCFAWPRWSQIENLSISWDNVNVVVWFLASMIP